MKKIIVMVIVLMLVLGGCGTSSKWYEGKWYRVGLSDGPSEGDYLEVYSDGRCYVSHKDELWTYSVSDKTITCADALGYAETYTLVEKDGYKALVEPEFVSDYENGDVMPSWCNTLESARTEWDEHF